MSTLGLDTATRRAVVGAMLLLSAMLAFLGFRGCNLNIAINGDIDNPTQRNESRIDHPSLDVASPATPALRAVDAEAPRAFPPSPR